MNKNLINLLGKFWATYSWRHKRIQIHKLAQDAFDLGINSKWKYKQNPDFNYFEVSSPKCAKGDHVLIVHYGDFTALSMCEAEKIVKAICDMENSE